MAVVLSRNTALLLYGGLWSALQENQGNSSGDSQNQEL
jgi:hypothetical protein